MICAIICVAGFLCMSHLDIVHISSVYVHIICILSEHMCIMHILSAVVLDIFLPNRQCQCDLYVISSTLYRSLHVVHTYTHYLLCIFHIPHIAYYLQLSFCNIVSIHTCHLHIIYMSSALLPMVSMGLNYLLLWQEFVIEWNLWQECWIFPFQDYVNDLRDNLCCWFSLHVTSGHCSHLICMCTYHLHIIWAYTYYAHIICTSPSYVLS